MKIQSLIANEQGCMLRKKSCFNATDLTTEILPHVQSLDVLQNLINNLWSCQNLSTIHIAKSIHRLHQITLSDRLPTNQSAHWIFKPSFGLKTFQVFHSVSSQTFHIYRRKLTKRRDIGWRGKVVGPPAWPEWRARLWKASAKQKSKAGLCCCTPATLKQMGWSTARQTQGMPAAPRTRPARMFTFLMQCPCLRSFMFRQQGDIWGPYSGIPLSLAIFLWFQVALVSILPSWHSAMDHIEARCIQWPWYLHFSRSTNTPSTTTPPRIWHVEHSPNPTRTWQWCFSKT